MLYALIIFCVLSTHSIDDPEYDPVHEMIEIFKLEEETEEEMCFELYCEYCNC